MRQLLLILLLNATLAGYGQDQPCVADSCCLEGTIWDEVLGGCVVANVSDTDFDGCVGINDFLVHLSNFGIGCGPEPTWACGDLLDYQGYEYETVQIGEQCWFAENLRSNNYRNGDDIPSGLGESEWTNSTIGAVSVYGEEGSSCSASSPAGNACDELFSLDEFGRLYNWYAVDDHRGLCPASWKVPTNSDWMTLELQLGISPLEIENGGWRGEQEAQLIKDSEGWYDGGSGTNSTGMTIKPAGIRNADGGFITAGQWAMLWSSSTTPENSAINRFLSSTQDRIALDVNDKRFGFSVRCIKDSE